MPGSVDAQLAALMTAVLEVRTEIGYQNVVVATTASAVAGLREETNRRHAQNTREIAKIHSGITESNAKVQRCADDIKTVAVDVAQMKPAVTRWSAREAFRGAIVKCVRRSWLRITAAVAFAGGLIVWLDGHWPKIAALLRKVGIGGN